MSDQTTPQDPSEQYPQPPDADTIAHPGLTEDMDTRPDHGEESYEGSNRLSGENSDERGVRVVSAPASAAPPQFHG